MGVSSLLGGKGAAFRRSRGKEKRFAPAKNAKTKRELRGTTLLARLNRATLARNVRHAPDIPDTLPGERLRSVPPRFHQPRGSLCGQREAFPFITMVNAKSIPPMHKKVKGARHAAAYVFA